MNRLFPLFCLCIVLPLCLLLAKQLLNKNKPKPVTVKPSLQRRESKLAHSLRLRTRAGIAEAFAFREGFSQRIAFLLDMRLLSGQKRFFIYDLRDDSVLAAGLVAHGSCYRRFSAEAAFSNAVGCGCSSVGRYKVGGVYQGRFGKAFKLHGLDSTNANAFRRNVVLHAYDCVPDEEVYPLPICNSLGCTMVSYNFLAMVADYIQKEKKPVLLWVYN